MDKVKDKIKDKVMDKVKDEAMKQVGQQAAGTTAGAGGMGAGTAAAALAAAAAVWATAGYGAYKADDYHKQAGLEGKEEVSRWSGAAASIDQVFQEGMFQRGKAFMQTGNFRKLWGGGNDEYGDEWDAQDFYMKQMGYDRALIEAKRKLRLDKKMLDAYKKTSTTGKILSSIEEMDVERQQLNTELLNSFNDRIKNQGLKDFKGNELKGPKDILSIDRNHTSNMNQRLLFDFRLAVDREKVLQEQKSRIASGGLSRDATEMLGDKGKWAHAAFTHIHKTMNGSPFDVYGIMNKARKAKNQKNKKAALTPIKAQLQQALDSMSGSKGFSFYEKYINDGMNAAGLDGTGWFGYITDSDLETALNGMRLYVRGQINNIDIIIQSELKVQKAIDTTAKLDSQRAIKKAAKDQKKPPLLGKEVSGSKGGGPSSQIIQQSAKNAQTETVVKSSSSSSSSQGNTSNTVNNTTVTYNNQKPAQMNVNVPPGSQGGVPEGVK